ncbi:hypothetical protein V5799_010197 [Amblyomma americanum]|uniref:SAP domain-containing protein n=1 Tax=Amblyomma americanum TaxID=6943 RepID=A0AAQ4F9X6_AMBAM
MASAGEGCGTVKRKITELKVVQLRAELEGRELDKSGSKPALIERLSKALEEEGLDPEVHEFDVPAESTPASRKMSYENTDLEKAPEAESELRAVEEAEQTDGESGKEASSEAMDADALQLSIEDEEKLLNEEEENFDKSKGKT